MSPPPVQVVSNWEKSTFDRHAEPFQPDPLSGTEAVSTAPHEQVSVNILLSIVPMIFPNSG